MYRKRRIKTSRRRRATALIAFAAVLVVSAGLPSLAFGEVQAVDNLLKTLGIDGTSGTTDGSGSGGATDKGGTPPAYEPPLHGTNPHGQGTSAVVDITPENSNPYPGNPGDGDEELIVGDSRGEQDANGQYHGSVTLAYLLGTPIVQIQTNPGESKDGPLQPLQSDLLDEICKSSDEQLCLSVLEMHSTTNDSSSTNSFLAAGAHIGGESGINAEVLRSNGNISDDGTCQTSHGDSSVLDANVGPLTADALQGSSTSTACNNGSQSVNQSSTVADLGGTGIPLPAEGCDDGTANVVFDALSPLLATVCNADDTNGSQTSAPYGVREALTVFALIFPDGTTSVLKATAAGPESHAVAPGGAQQPPTPTTGGGGGGTKGAGGKGGGAAGEGGGDAGGEAAAGDGSLAFTGADLLFLGMVGGALILGGMALTTTAGRRHRQTV